MGITWVNPRFRYEGTCFQHRLLDCNVVEDIVDNLLRKIIVFVMHVSGKGDAEDDDEVETNGGGGGCFYEGQKMRCNACLVSSYGPEEILAADLDVAVG